MVEQTFECSNCYEVFNKEHTTEVLWTQCPHCGGRAYPYLAAPPAPRRLVGIEREARPRDNATMLYPPAKAALVFQKDQPPFSM